MSQIGGLGSGGGGGGGVTSITGNDGTPLITGAVQITTGINPGTPFFSVSGQELILNQSDGAPQNVSWGGLNFGDEPLTVASRNCAFGVSALEEPTDLSSASYNNAFGNNALSGLTTGGKNNAVGWRSLFQLLTGENNCAFGDNSGNAYTTSESANICIGASVLGTAGESNVLRIGESTGTGATGINKCFIQGIYSQNSSGFSSPRPVYVDTSTGQLGYGSASSGIGTINGNSGSVTGSTITISVAASNGTSLFTGSSTTLSFTTSDSQANTSFGLNSMPTGASNQFNTAYGTGALKVLSDNSNTYNTAIGANSLLSLTSDSGQNTAVGLSSLASYNGGSGLNTAIGAISGNSLGSGSSNVFIGANSASNYTGSESSNIIIGEFNAAVLGESNVLRIGNATGSSRGNLAAAYIQGIAGVTVGTSAAVLIDTSSGQLGTVPSAARYKENIEDMEDESEIIYKLRPVRYNLRAHPEYGVQTGLVADEVQRIAPRLVSINPKGEPESVAYHELPALILNELQKLSKRVAALEGR